MQSHEADEFIKLFTAMDKRFKAQYNFPVLISAEGWILSRTSKEIWVACSRRKTQSAGLKGLCKLKKSTNLFEFRLFKSRIHFYSGENKNINDLGAKRAVVTIGAPWYNWIGGTKNLLKKLGMIEEVRANLSDPELLEG